MAILGTTSITNLTLLSGVTGHLLPTTTNLYDLGSQEMQWKEIYANKINGDGSGLTQLNANNLNSGTIPLTRLATISGLPTTSIGPNQNVSPALGETFTVPQITVDDKGRVTTLTSRTITLPTITLQSLGLTGVMKFIGITSTAMSDGLTGSILINNESYTPTLGDVVLDSDSSAEYIYTTANKWELLGNENGYKIKQEEVASPATGNTPTIDFIATVAQTTNGNISATKQSIRTATTSVSGIVTLSNDLNSTSETLAATSKAVNLLNTNKLEISGGTITGNLVVDGTTTLNDDLTVDNIINTQLLTQQVVISTNNVTPSEQLYVDGSGRFTQEIYADFYHSQANASSNPGYHGFQIEDTSGNRYGSLYIQQKGTTTNIGNSGLSLGNNIASDNANNSQGTIYLYGKNKGYSGLRTALNSTNSYWVYLPNYAGTSYLTHTASTNAVGSSINPVYVAANGRITATDIFQAGDKFASSDTGTILYIKTDIELNSNDQLNIYGKLFGYRTSFTYPGIYGQFSAYWDQTIFKDCSYYDPFNIIDTFEMYFDTNNKVIIKLTLLKTYTTIRAFVYCGREESNINHVDTITRSIEDTLTLKIAGTLNNGTTSGLLDSSGVIKTPENFFPIFYSGLDFTNTNPNPGVYRMQTTHPVTNEAEYGSALSLSKTSINGKGYDAQLIISSASGSSEHHVYVRRLTSSSTWLSWTKILTEHDVAEKMTTLSLDNTTTVATINSKDIKINLPTIYCGNVTATSTATYNTTPEVHTVTIGNGTASTTATKKVTMQYDETLETLNFVFI